MVGGLSRQQAWNFWHTSHCEAKDSLSSFFSDVIDFCFLSFSITLIMGKTANTMEWTM